MGFLKKVLKKATSIINPAAKAEEEAKRAAAAAEEEAKRQALIQAQNATATDTAPETDATTESTNVETDGDKKKKLASGRKSLTVARSGGSGINI